MPAFDTSSLIYAWDNYPPEIFPPLWNWLQDEIREQRVVFSIVVKEEVANNSPECADWLAGCQPTFLGATQAILVGALNLKMNLGIVEDKYGNGVGENDLIIVATSRAHNLDLVSDESKQPNLPSDRKKYKIPAVCGLPQVQVRCQSFLEFLRTSNQVFRG